LKTQAKGKPAERQGHKAKGASSGKILVSSRHASQLPKDVFAIKATLLSASRVFLFYFYTETYDQAKER